MIFSYLLAGLIISFWMDFQTEKNRTTEVKMYVRFLTMIVFTIFWVPCIFCFWIMGYKKKTLKVNTTTVQAVPINPNRKTKTYPWPHCDVCEKGIEKISTKKDNINLITTFTLQCHGQTQTLCAHADQDVTIIRAFVNNGTEITIQEDIET